MNHSVKKAVKNYEIKLNKTVLFKQNFFKNSQNTLKKPEVLSNNSPYNKKIPKMRSESNFNNKTIHSCSNSGLASPLFGFPSNANIPKKKISLTNILLPGNAKVPCKSIGGLNEILMTTNENPFEDEINYANEAELNKLEKRSTQLEKMLKNGQVTYEVFDLYKVLFKDLIEKDKQFGPLLKKIKNVYENWIQTKVGHVVENAKLKYENSSLTSTIEDFQNQLQFLLEKIRQISEENAKLGREAEMKDSQYHYLQEHLIKISNAKTENFTKNEDTWKLLLTENNTYKEICEGMKQDIKNLNANEKMLLKLLDCLKIQGYPVDEVYKEKIKKKKIRKVTRPAGSEDEENLNNDPVKVIKRPMNVPQLKFSLHKKKSTLKQDYSDEY